MIRYLFYSVLIIVLVGCQIKPKTITQTEATACKDFKTGQFKLNHKLFGMTTTIVRNDSTQVETSDIFGTSVEFTYNIKWLNDCMYELTPNPTFQNDIDMSDQSSMVKIRKIEGNSMYYKSYRDGKRLRSNSNKMTKIEKN